MLSCLTSIQSHLLLAVCIRQATLPHFVSICLPMQETLEIPVQSLGWGDTLEEEMVTHSGILAWKIQWTEDTGELQSMGLQRVEHNLVTEHAHTTVSELILLWNYLVLLIWHIFVAFCFFKAASSSGEAKGGPPPLSSGLAFLVCFW